MVNGIRGPDPLGERPRDVDESMTQDRLRSVFGYDSFRPLQGEIVRSILSGRDVFVLMPTGGGKSLCYQLPALLMSGLTVVVSPLIALMKDQVDALQALGVAATFINSSLEAAEIGRRQAAVARGEVKLLYVAPERFSAAGFLHLLSSQEISFFAVDEAHCISEWGHDFRPEYRDLRKLRDLFPTTPMGAFTATATQRVQVDIRAQLRLERAEVFQGGFNRPNLFYEVRSKRSAYQQLAAYLRRRGPGSGIVYCQSRAGTEELASRLRSDGFSAVAYHAGLESGERRQRQESFVRDDVQIMVATIAFGMGIDKPDVRFVIHYDLPKNLEGYYQESGRAGRDGEPSDCILFYSYADVVKQRHFIDEKPSARERQIALRQLRQMANWASGATCRRRALLSYFEESLEEHPGPCCDVCSAPSQEAADFTIPAQMFLSCVKRTGERFSITHVIAVLRGSRKEPVIQAGHESLSTFGIGMNRTTKDWQHLAGELMSRGYIGWVPGLPGAVKATELGEAVLFRGERVLLPLLAAEQAPLSPEEDSQPNRPLYEQLRTLRKRLADERGVPPYVIFHDATLAQISAQLPTSRERFLRVQGIGERKATNFGEPFMECVAEYVRQTGARPVEPQQRAAKRRRSGEMSLTVLATLDLFKAGIGIEGIAAERSLTTSTIEGHLAEALEAGEAVDIDRLIGKEKREAITSAMREVGTALLAPVKELLGEGYSYGELRLVRAAMDRTEATGG